MGGRNVTVWVRLPVMCSVQRDHKDLLNKTHTAARCSGAGSSSECKPDSSSSPSPSSDTGFHRGGSTSSTGSPPAAARAPAAGHPAAALHRMHNNLQALRVRKQRVTGGTPLTELQQQAESASERLLLAKLQEAGRIMEEQESVSLVQECYCNGGSVSFGVLGATCTGSRQYHYIGLHVWCTRCWSQLLQCLDCMGRTLHMVTWFMMLILLWASFSSGPRAVTWTAPAA